PLLVLQRCRWTISQERLPTLAQGDGLRRLASGGVDAPAIRAATVVQTGPGSVGDYLRSAEGPGSHRGGQGRRRQLHHRLLADRQARPDSYGQIVRPQGQGPLVRSPARDLEGDRSLLEQGRAGVRAAVPGRKGRLGLSS